MPNFSNFGHRKTEQKLHISIDDFQMFIWMFEAAPLIVITRYNNRIKFRVHWVLITSRSGGSITRDGSCTAARLTVAQIAQASSQKSEPACAGNISAFDRIHAQLEQKGPGKKIFKPITAIQHIYGDCYQELKSRCQEDIYFAFAPF